MYVRSIYANIICIGCAVDERYCIIPSLSAVVLFDPIVYIILAVLAASRILFLRRSKVHLRVVKADVLRPIMIRDDSVEI